MLKIRLARIGKRNNPTYRFIVSETARDTYGKVLEILGNYNPFTKICEVKKERILYWLSCGAKLSPTVNNLLIDQNVISGSKVRASRSKKNKETAKAVGEKKEGKKEEQPTKPKIEPKVATTPSAAPSSTKPPSDQPQPAQRAGA